MPQPLHLYFDPMGIKTFADLSFYLAQRATPLLRRKGFEFFLRNNRSKIQEHRKINAGSIIVMKGAKYNETELHIAEKLAKAGYIALFPNQGDLGKGRKNDVYLYDNKAYIQHKAELKSLFGYSAETIKHQLLCGVIQANVIVYDIQSNIKKNWLIEGLRCGWSQNLKMVLLNWKGQWYKIKKDDLFTQSIYHTLK